MADCYECYHYKACSNIGDSGFSYLPEDASKCRYFKHKEDVKEVVRCKDCIFYEPHGNGKLGICRHLKLKRYLKHNIDFCSYGERRETE